MKFLIFLIIFFITASLLVIESNSLGISKHSDIQEFSNIYGSWINGVYKNVINITGHAIKLDWMPEQNLSQANP